MGFKLINKNIKFPPLYPSVERKLPTAKERGYTKVGDFVIRKDIDFIPQEGMQENICACDSNLIFMCGQATSGKSFAMYLKALGGIDKFGFTSRIINVRALDSQKGSSMFRDGVTVLGNFAKCEYTSSGVPTFSYPQWNSNLQLIHSNFNVKNPTEWKDFQDYAKKQQSSLIMIDECTEMEEFKMFAYWFMRNRDNSGMMPQMICSFNPLYGHWTNDMLIQAGYIDLSTWHLKPEMVGKTRFFYVAGDSANEIIWGDTREQVANAAGLRDKPEDIAAGITRLDYVKSFTVFTGAASGNRELVNATGGQSVANLHAVGKTQRAVVGEAYFGPIDHEELNVSRQMILNLFTNPSDNDTTMYATMDVSGGKADGDNCPMFIFRGNTLINIEIFHGTPKELVEWINLKLKTYGIAKTNFAFDATGIGFYLTSFTEGMPITPNKRPIQEVDERGNIVLTEQYFNLRSQLLGKMKVMLERGDLAIAIDKDYLIPRGKKGEKRKLIDILFDQMNVFRATTRNNKIYYRSKDEYKSNFNESPDEMDTFSYIGIFHIDARPKKAAKEENEEDAYSALYDTPPRVAGFKRY